MGWKSSKDITREESMKIILDRLYMASNDELSHILLNLGFGDDINLPHYGYNFNVVDKSEDNKEL